MSGRRFKHTMIYSLEPSPEVLKVEISLFLDVQGTEEVLDSCILSICRFAVHDSESSRAGWQREFQVTPRNMVATSEAREAKEGVWGVEKGLYFSSNYEATRKKRDWQRLTRVESRMSSYW